MAALFEKDGIRFRYPENWRVETEDTASGWSVSVQSPGTAFVMLSVDLDMPPVEQVAETTLTALREEYPELEADACVDAVAGLPAVGHEIQFFSLDLTNTCWTRSFYGGGGTILLMWQINDLELDEHEPVLKAIASVEVEED